MRLPAVVVMQAAQHGAGDEIPNHLWVGPSPWWGRARLKYSWYCFINRYKCRSLKISKWSRHSRHTLPRNRSQTAFAFGCTGRILSSVRQLGDRIVSHGRAFSARKGPTAPSAPTAAAHRSQTQSSPARRCVESPHRPSDPVAPARRLGGARSGCPRRPR
jgi:hypothetical protein